jgi:UrcA family protein
MKTLLIIAAALSSSAAAAQPVVDADSPAIERVGFADLDLSSDAGVRMLQTRVDAAAQRLCDEDGVQPLAQKLAQKKCFNTAHANGFKQIERIAYSRRAGTVIAAATAAVQR